MITFRLFCIQEASSNSPCHTLGVLPTASRKEVSTAYRRLAMMFHPDKHVGKPDSDDFETIFKIILNAYNALNDQPDPKRRMENPMGCRDDGAPSPWASGEHGMPPRTTASASGPSPVPEPEEQEPYPDIPNPPPAPFPDHLKDRTTSADITSIIASIDSKLAAGEIDSAEARRQKAQAFAKFAQE